MYSCRAPELDDESKDTTTDQYEHYSSSQCFNTTPNNFSANQNVIRCGVLSDNIISGPAPNRGMPVCYVASVETGPKNKGVEILDSPILTTPQINPWSLFQYGGI